MPYIMTTKTVARAIFFKKGQHKLSLIKMLLYRFKIYQHWV